ncbi:MAG TPA: hypothetical protein VIY47_06760, partial [Ignavibacteriaceae bacterium]
MFKVMLFSWLINSVAGGAVDTVTSKIKNSVSSPTPSYAPSMASQEAIRLGYVGQLMDLCGRTMGWQDDTMLEILQRGAGRAMRFGATQEMLSEL